MAKLYWVLIFLLGGLLACSSDTHSVQQGEVVTVYSNALTTADRQLFLAFEQSSGIKVNIINDTGANIIERLQQQDSAVADLLLLEGISYLQQAKQLSLLDTLSQGSIVNAIPSHLRDQNLQWLGLAYSANVIAYLADSVDEAQIQGYNDLANPEWKGKLGWGSRNKNVYHSQLAAMLADEGNEAQTWISDLADNLVDTSRNHDPVNFTISDSSAWLSLLNTAEYIKYLSRENRFQPVRLLFPSPLTYLHLTGVGLMHDAPHSSQARSLLNYLFSRDIIAQYCSAHYVYPSRPDIEIPASIRNLGLVRADTSQQTNIARYTDEAKSLVERYGW